MYSEVTAIELLLLGAAWLRAPDKEAVGEENDAIASWPS
jgi:hypothetical protein